MRIIDKHNLLNPSLNEWVEIIKQRDFIYLANDSTSISEGYKERIRFGKNLEQKIQGLYKYKVNVHTIIVFSKTLLIIEGDVIPLDCEPIFKYYRYERSNIEKIVEIEGYIKTFNFKNPNHLPFFSDKEVKMFKNSIERWNKRNTDDIYRRWNLFVEDYNKQFEHTEVKTFKGFRQYNSLSDRIEVEYRVEQIEVTIHFNYEGDFIIKKGICIGYVSENPVCELLESWRVEGQVPYRYSAMGEYKYGSSRGTYYYKKWKVSHGGYSDIITTKTDDGDF